MKLTVVEASDAALRVRFDDVAPHVVNALRRTLIADVPKMAIEDVEFHLGPIRGEDGKEYESVAPLFDEVVAQRLGLVPIPTDLKLFNRRQECPNCKGEGCPSCTIIYSLNKRGPATVFSGDLEPIGDPSLRVKDPNIPLTKLGDGQALLVYATAQLGTGREHAKFQVAQGVGYSFVPILKVGAKTFEAAQSKVPPCVDHILVPTKDEEVVELRTDCKACKKFAEEYNTKSVKVSWDQRKVELHFETDGSLNSTDTFLAALDILEKRFREIEALATGMSEPAKPQG